MLTRRRQEIARLACTQDVLEALLPPSGERRHRSRSLGKYPVAQPLDRRRRVSTLELSTNRQSDRGRQAGRDGHTDASLNGQKPTTNPRGSSRCL